MFSFGSVNKGTKLNGENQKGEKSVDSSTFAPTPFVFCTGDSLAASFTCLQFEHQKLPILIHLDFAD
jgi:hypothetical protein